MLLKVFGPASIDYASELSQLQACRFIEHLPISAVINVLVQDFLSICTQLYDNLPRFIVFIVILHAHYSESHQVSTLHKVVVRRCGLRPQVH